jgi:ankyrin repeat protein
VLVPCRVSTGVHQIPLLLYMALFSNHPHTELGESVRLLVDAGAHINALGGPESDERTALMCACERSCCIKVLQVYLQNGADVLVCSPAKGLTALHYVATRGRTDNCELLLARESSAVHVRAVDGSTALMRAGAGGHTHIVKLLLQHGAAVSMVSSDNRTALVAACVNGHIDVAAVLIEAGADLNAVDSTGNGALTAAVKSNNAELVQLLLDHGADISTKDKQGGSAMFMAAHYGHVAMLDLLVKRGLSIAAVDNTGNTVLMTAAARGHKLATEWLLQHGAAVYAVTSHLGYTALHMTSGSSSCDAAAMIELLLANGADVHKRGDNGCTALDAAADSGNMQCAKALIAAGADVHSGVNNGATGLHLAVIKQHAHMVELLLRRPGARAVMDSVISIECSNNEHCCAEQTALMLCTTVDAVRALLAAGADVHVTTAAGDTCLHTACRHGLPVPVLCLLIKAGADLHAVNSAGKTAAHIAHDRGHLLTEQLLNRAAQQQEH